MAWHRGARPIGGAPHRKAVTLANPSPRVRLPEVVVGVLVIAGSALATLVWHSSSSATTPALVLAADVARGHVLVEADFAAAEVRTVGVRLVPFDQRSAMLGRIAVVDLRAADPITDAVAVELLPIADDQALVSRRLEAGEFPDGIAPGSAVRVILLADAAATGAAGQGPTTNDGGAGSGAGTPVDAVVEDVRPGETAADISIVTLRVPDALADAVAAAGEVRLVQVRG